MKGEKIRVGINARAFSVKHPGGNIQVGIKLTKHLLQSPLAQEEFEFILFGDPSLKNMFENITVVSEGYKISNNDFGIIWEQTVLPYLAQKYKVDILFCPNDNGPIYPKIYTKHKVITMVHDISALVGKWHSRKYRVYAKIRFPSVLKYSDMIITVSKFSKKEFANKLGISPKKIKVVYNGIDEIFFQKVHIRKIDLDLPEEYILFVGSLNPRKNIERLILAYMLIKKEINIPLILIGPKKDIFRKINIPKDKDIIPLGFVSQEELKYAYQNASLFVFPSLYEGFGLPPLEAMACGTPVVASNVASLPEVLGDAAHYVNPYNVREIAEGMLHVLNDRKYAKKLSRKGKKQARRFKWDFVVQKILNLIKEAEFK